MACVIVDLVTAPVDDKINLTVYNSTDVNVSALRLLVIIKLIKSYVIGYRRGHNLLE